VNTFIIGELLNSSRKEVREALQAKDRDTVARLARQQVEAGAGALDVNAAQSMENEAADLRWMIEVVQEEVGDVRLAVDTADPRAMEAALADCRAMPIVNSISNERSRAPMVELAAAGEAEVVGLAMGKKGMPKTADDRFEEAHALVELCASHGISKDRLIVDVLCMSVASDPQQGLVALEAAKRIKHELGVRVCVAVSNVSFGLPGRPVLNRTYLAMVVAAGVDVLISDPTGEDMQETLYAAEALAGQDNYCMGYIKYQKRKRS